MNKLEYFIDLKKETALNIISNAESWKSFLRTASHLYKYPFTDQIMIHAQRPDATACASYDLWNQRMHRYIKRGADGIALLVQTKETAKIKYVFDIADTKSLANSLSPVQWEYSSEHEDAVINALSDAWKIDNSSLSDVLPELVQFIVSNYWYDHTEDIEGSLLASTVAQYDSDTLQGIFCAAAVESALYVINERCHIWENTSLFQDGDTWKIGKFDSVDAISELGSAVSSCSETVLRQIEKAVKQYDRTKNKLNKERMTEYEHQNERTQLHQEGRLLHSGFENERVRDEASSSGQIRQDAKSISAGESSGNLDRNVHEGDSLSGAEESRSDGEGETGFDDSSDGQGSGSDGVHEADGSHEVGRTDEHHSGPGRGDYSEGIDLHLDQQFSFFPSESQQIEYIEHIEAEGFHEPSAFTLPQSYIDTILRSGSNHENARKIIAAEFSKGKSLQSQALLLQKLFHGGYGIIDDNKYISAWYDDLGIRISQSKTAKFTRAAQIITWEDAAKRINTLLEDGIFASNVELEEAHGYECEQLAEKLWYLNSDLSNIGREMHLLANLNAHLGNGGFPTEVDSLKKHLEKPSGCNEIISDMEEFLEAYHANSSILRFKYHKPEQLKTMLQEFHTERKLYRSDMTDVYAPLSFITEDEIDSVITGGTGTENGKYDIYNFFQDGESSHKDKVDKLKSLYGTGGRSHAISGSPHSSEEHDSKGEHLIKLGCSDILLSWDKVVHRIEKLIEQERYITPEEIQTALINKAKHIIRSFCGDEYQTHDKVDFSDLSKIDIAYTTTEDDLHEIQSSVDLLNYQINTRIDNTLVRSEQYKSLNEMVTSVLPNLSFDELVSVSDEELSTIVDQESKSLAERLADFIKDFDTFHYMDSLQVGESEENAISEIEDQLQNPESNLISSLKELIDDGNLSPTQSAELTSLITEVESTIPSSASEKPFIDHYYVVKDLQNRGPLDLEEYSSVQEALSAYEALPSDKRKALGVQNTNPLPGSLDFIQCIDGEDLLIDDWKKVPGWENSEISSLVFELDVSLKEHALNIERQKIVDSLPEDNQRIVHAMNTAGYIFKPPRQKNEIVFTASTDGYPIVFASWTEAEAWIDSAELKDEPGLREKVQSILHDDTNLGWAKENLSIGQTFDWDGRRFKIESIDDQTEMIDLQDLTFIENAGFPISRIEPITAVRNHLQSMPEDLHYDPILNGDLTTQAKNFHIIDSHLGEGGPKAKYLDNIRAIQILKTLDLENRHAEPDEQEILSRYVGWGGLADAFDPDKASWSREYQELREILTPAEYEAARSSTLNAHYTSPVVIQSIYHTVENLGFKTGNILEPSCGVGNFFGMLPPTMENSRLYGVELDSISGRIAQKLYPKANITVAGFETTNNRDFYDLAIGNVPFGQYQVNDKDYNKLHFNIHNYFFAKALDQVRAGGIVAFVTSRFTMDAKDSTVRRYLCQRANLLGAIRLPNNAFKKNAGAEVVSDIIFLQKRERPLDIIEDWVQSAPNEKGYFINQYFLDHPEMVLGQESEISTAHGMDYTVEPDSETSLSDQLLNASDNIQGSYHEAEILDLDEITDGEVSTIPADPSVKNYSFTIVDGSVYYRENSIMEKPELNTTAIARVKGMIHLRDCVHSLMDLQMDPSASDQDIQLQQAELNRQYDAFTAKFDLINSRANKSAFSLDSSYYLLCGLEELDEDGKLLRKADMFTRRTIKPHQAVTSVDTASEALAVSISEKAKVDIPYMEQLTGKSREQLEADLSGIIFRLPFVATPEADPVFVTADEYLSGNVREKLRDAQEAAKVDPVTFQANVEALTAAQPQDLDASEIEVRLGATWINKKYIQQFMEETFDTPWYLRRSIKIQYSPLTAEWQVEGKSNIPYNDVAAYTSYGTERASAYRILEDSLNLRDIRVYDTIEDADGRQRRVLNSKETTLASQKQQAIREAFKDWIWKDPERRQDLVKQYNEEMNSTRPREYDGSHIVFGGMNPEISLREHQKNAIAHVLYGGNTLLAHEVGAGKTFEMVAAAMEAKRLGLCTKSLFAVPNHLTEQWASEFLRLYPGANILVTTKKDFEPKNRKKFCARIATGDYDAVIMGHSQFEKIPISQERQERLLEDQIAEITEGIEEMRFSGSGGHFTVKQLERTKKSLETQLNKLQSQDRKDDVVTFEQLGVDRLFVDEAHNFKNLFLYTKMRNVAGLSTTDAQKSSDMFAKCRYMDELTGGKGVIFATGTPVSNSMTELYTMQRYLQYDRLKEMNMTHFDCWASRFGETVTALELAPEGTGYRARTRFSKFYNLPELMNIFREVADIKTADQLHLPTPEVEYHNVVAKPTEHQKEMVASLSERAAQVHSGVIDPSQDNMLKITSDGRKLGLDQRIISGLLPDEPGTKVNQCVDNILRLWLDGEPEKLTQLVFCDISTPKSKGSKSDEFSVYDDIRSKLIAGGMPAEQIAFIHDADTEAKKKTLFSKVRSGQVRVLLGSTAKLGAGTNVQDRLIALHDLDCPWRPGDLEQRKGRIERQGNRNEKVHVFRYVTEGTFDAYLWQTVENKQKFISQIMSSKSPVRSCEDVDETALSFAEIKALCAGDPRIKERMDLDVDVTKLKVMKADYQSKQFKLQDQILQYFPEQIELSKGRVAGLKKDMETASSNPHPVEGFAGMNLLGKYYTDKLKAGEQLLAICQTIKSSEPYPIGNYRGFSLALSFNPFEKSFTLSIKGQLTHPVELGNDPRGNLTRIDNALAFIPEKLKGVEAHLDNLYKQKAAAGEEVKKPFAFEQELTEKTNRLIELDSILNMDKQPPVSENALEEQFPWASKKQLEEIELGISSGLSPEQAAERAKSFSSDDLSVSSQPEEISEPDR